MKKKIIISDKFHLNFQKKLILKNSLNYIFFKKLKYLHKKNIFLNYFFYNSFINLYKSSNLEKYLLYFFYQDLNFFYIYNINIFKKQFIYNLNFLKNLFNLKKFKFLFLKKIFKSNFYFDNCLLINSCEKNLNLNADFLENFILLKIDKKKFNYNYFFINFNIFIFSLLEIYKILILLYLQNIKLIKKYI